MWGMSKLRYRTQKSTFICIHTGDDNTDVSAFLSINNVCMVLNASSNIITSDESFTAFQGIVDTIKGYVA